MAVHSLLVVAGSLVLILVLLASVLGAVKRRERFVFVGGVALFIAAHVALQAVSELAILLAVAGLAAVVVSVLPLLRQPA